MYRLRANWPIYISSVILLLMAARGASAQDLCSRPIEPLCTTTMQTLRTEPERLRCIEDVRRYREAMVAYRDCAKNMVVEAEDSLDKAEKLEACIDSGKEDCTLETDDKLDTGS